MYDVLGKVQCTVMVPIEIPTPNTAAMSRSPERRGGVLRYSSIRLRSDLIYANSGGGGHGSIGDVLTTIALEYEYPTAAYWTLFGCI